MRAVRIMITGTWFPNSDSTVFHTRVVTLDTETLETVHEHHDRHAEILHGGGSPAAVLRERSEQAIRTWGRAIDNIEPF